MTVLPPPRLEYVVRLTEPDHGVMVVFSEEDFRLMMRQFMAEEGDVGKAMDRLKAVAISHVRRL